MSIKEESYALIKHTEFQYEFLSEGPKGMIKKMISYDRFKTVHGWYYNLGFGDFCEKSGEIRDDVISNNGDVGKILYTVAKSVIDFVDNHPDTIIFAAGNTPARTRLYQIGIARVIEEINISFIIYGFTNDNWEIFKKGGVYSSFLCMKRIY